MKQMNRRAFVDTDIIYSPGFTILAVMAVSATLLGWTLGPKMGVDMRFPIWQLLVIIAIELGACYVIVGRG